MTRLISLIPKIKKDNTNTYTSKHGSTVVYYASSSLNKKYKTRLKESIKQEVVSMEETYSSV